MKTRERKHWERVRKMGMAGYVLINGVMAWGVPMFVIMTFVFKHSRLPIWQSAVLWLTAGAAFGITMWLVNEHRYRKTISTDKSAL